MAPSTSVDEPLRLALREFQDILSPDQQKDLLARAAVPDAAAVIILTAEIDSENAKRRSRGVATRLFSFLESVQQFSSIVDTFVSSNPQIAALVWGSVKFALLAASNFSSYFDKLSAIFMNLRNYFPKYSEYQILYPSSIRLQAALCAFYATVVRFCKKALEVVQRKGDDWQTESNWPLVVGFVHAAASLWRPFEVEFGDFQNEIKRQNKDVWDETNLAFQQAQRQDRLLQVAERDAASQYRLSGHLFRRRVKLESDEARNWRLQANERQSRERKERLLKSLSSYDYKTAFKQARRKRYGTTCSWIAQTSEFRDWLDCAQSSSFWCYGIPGSGKTVLTASVVDELFCRNPTNRPFVRFFFCRYDQPESLKAKTILGSLIKQCLDIDSMSSQLEAELGQLLESSPPDFEDLNELMESVLSVSKDQFIVIDAIDECEKAERNLFLSALRRFIDSPKATLKIFLTSGLHIGVELERALEPNYRMSMASPHTHSDIKTYIESSIAEKLENGELVVGQPQLIIEVRDALVGGAQGMFLWATFQIQDICDQGCDRDIRKAIGNLPKDLPETYERALTKIDSARTAQVVQKIFRWVAAAKRPLSLEELREAIAIQPGQPSLQSEALENETSRLIPYCGNLIVFDEEDQAVQFAHHTIKQFLLTESRNPSLDGFHFGLPRANYDIGEVCVTYLNFSDFQRQLAKISHMQARLSNPAAMLKTSLSAGLNLSTRSYWLRWVQLGASRNAGEIDVERQLYDAAGVKDPGPFEKLQAAYALFPYASEYWIYHSSDFSERYTGTWRLWSNLLLTENSFAHMPWAFDEWTRRTQSVIQWIIQNDHCALLRHIESSDMNSLSWRDRRRLLIDSAAQGRSQIVSVLISSGRIPKTDLGVALQAAAGEGHLDVVEWLLEAEANVNAAAAPAAGRSGQTASQVRSRLGVIGGVLVASGYNGRTALQAAAGSGHFDVVERLLWANADVNAAAAEHDGRTALQAAAGGGHVVVVERLLAAGANVNGAPGFNHGRTALQAAAEEGHLEIVKRLLAMNAHANAAAGGGFDGRTALQAAAGEGHLKVVEILLAVGANANAAAAGYDGRTALQAAAGGGHVEVAKRLLAAGASVNAPGSAGSGSRTALQAASGGGYLDVVEMLLEAKAEVNADPVGFDGRTALQAAAEGGHLDVVERLLAAKADVDASGGGYDCPTALQAAAGGGNLEVFERLLAAKTNVNAATSYDGQAALRVAARGGHLDVVEKLVVMGATDNAIGFDGPTALEAAALGGHLKVVERLLARKTDAIAATDGNRKAMRAAAEGGHLDVVEMLLVAKVDVNGNAGGAALQAAAKGGHLDVVKRLLAANADVNVAGRDGQTALQAAAEGGHLEVVERLLAAKAKDSATDTVDPLVARMALQAAAEGGHLDVVERLLVAKADVSNERGLAALHAAAREGHLDVVDRLLEAKADVNATVNTYINRTVLRAAAWGGHLHVVERLLAAKADVSNDKGRAALDAAVGGGHGEVVERLKLAGAKW